MAETAKIISPDKMVLLPEPSAGCPMADMITAETLKQLKSRHPGAKAMCYVNSTTEVKAECTICCTSSNAIAITRKAFLPEEEVIFVPDRHLANYTARELNRTFITHKGFCPTHARILPEHIQNARIEHPCAEVLVHPECSLAVIDQADKALSTGGMSRYVKDSSTKEFIIGTEIGMVYRLSKDNPDKTFYPLSQLIICPNMKKTTLDKVVHVLETLNNQVIIEETIADRAYEAIRKMLAYS